MKITIKILFVTFTLGLILGMVQMMFKYLTPEPVYRVKTLEGGVIDLERNYELFDCTPLKRNDGNYLNYCVRKEQLKVIPNQSYVMGSYTRWNDTVWVDKNSPNDRIVHEIFHSSSVYHKNEEKKAHEFQNLYIQLEQKGYIK